MKNKDLTLLKAFQELESITQEFEKEEVDLEQGIPKFKRGLELAKFLKKRLIEIENELKEVKAEFGETEEEVSPKEPAPEEIQENKEEEIPF